MKQRQKENKKKKREKNKHTHTHKKTTSYSTHLSTCIPVSISKHVFVQKGSKQIKKVTHIR